MEAAMCNFHSMDLGLPPSCFPEITSLGKGAAILSGHSASLWRDPRGEGLGDASQLPR